MKIQPNSLGRFHNCSFLLCKRLITCKISVAHCRFGRKMERWRWKKRTTEGSQKTKENGAIKSAYDHCSGCSFQIDATRSLMMLIQNIQGESQKWSVCCCFAHPTRPPSTTGSHPHSSILVERLKFVVCTFLLGVRSGTGRHCESWIPKCRSIWTCKNKWRCGWQSFTLFAVQTLLVASFFSFFSFHLTSQCCDTSRAQSQPHMFRVWGGPGCRLHLASLREARLLRWLSTLREPRL